MAITRTVPGTGDALYDANRLYGQVLYVNGLETDQPLAITRNHYAGASSTTGSATYAVYAPFSIVPLWNSQGRADRAVIGGTAAPGQDYLCADTGKTRCANVFLDQGVFPYARSGAAMGAWNGTVLVDKPDATGTYYRRNRSYYRRRRDSLRKTQSVLRVGSMRTGLLVGIRSTSRIRLGSP